MNQDEIMLELLRSAVLDRAPSIPHSAIVDWEGLMNLSAGQGILAWVWDGICKLPQEQQPARKDRISWSLSALDIADRYKQHEQVLEQMVQVCQKNDIKLLLLKGIGLSKLYPKPSSRPSGDLDVFFWGEYEKGNQLFAQTNISVSKKHSSFDYLGVHVENHRTLLNQDWYKRRRIEKYIQSNIDKSVRTSEGYYILEPESNLLFLTMHAIRHLRYSGSSGLSLRSIVDVSIFLLHHRNKLAPSRCFQLMDQFGVAHCFELMVCLGEWVLNIKLSDYRRDLLPESDKMAAYRTFIERDCVSPISGNVSFWQKRKIHRTQLRQYRWKYHYEPYSPFSRLYFETKLRLRSIVMSLLNLPQKGSFKQNLKNKFNV